MSRPFLWLLVAVLASPAVAYFIYRLARELGFLDPPADRQHELKRTIIVSLYAFLLLLPVGIYGTEKGWPRAWILFGIVEGVALAIFAYGGIRATLQLWKLRHPEPVGPIAEGPEGESPPAELQTGGQEERQETVPPGL